MSKWGYGEFESQEEIAQAYRRTRARGVHNMTDEEIEQQAEKQWKELQEKHTDERMNENGR